MMDNDHTPVLVVGAGPVGLALAALLTQHGIQALVVDRNLGPTMFSKAIGIHARTLESMSSLGVAEHLVAAGRPLPDAQLWEDGRVIFQTSFRQIGSRHGSVLALPQRETECILAKRLAMLGGEIQWGQKLLRLESVGEPGGTPARAVLVGTDGRERMVTADWVVGADGGRSTVRTLAGIGFPGGDYGRAFILGDAVLEWDGPRNELQFFLSGVGYLLVIPMPNGLHRIIAQTNHTYTEFQGVDRPEATLAELQAVIDRNGPGGMRVRDPEWVTAAPFYHRMADTPWCGCVLLAGDAFHLFSPLGAQGLNTGFQDAFNLAWKLALVIKGLGPPALLRSCAPTQTSVRRWPNVWRVSPPAPPASSLLSRPAPGAPAPVSAVC